MSDDKRAEYQALREEFVTKTAAMLREYEKSGSADLERDIRQCLKDMDNARATLEVRLGR
ncbi:MAG: hypothetical protein NC299_02890 [Lachnospiraceae bacterium]|nr:hypothetical protein [Ruminococcus sp.]MCM1274297.1 hypothetical protein [Lachnospiraceae bacterium]